MSESSNSSSGPSRAGAAAHPAGDDPEGGLLSADGLRSTSNIVVPTLDYALRPEMDVGRVVGLYLQVWAMGGLVSIAISLFLDRPYLDASPLLLWWAGSALKRRSQTARLWCLLLGRIAFYGGSLMVLWGTVVGFNNSTVRLGSMVIHDPPGWMILLITLPMLAIVGVPLFLLESKRAQRQFERPKNPYNEPAAVAERLRNVR